MPFDGVDPDRHRPERQPSAAAWWLVWPCVWMAGVGYCVCKFWGGRG